MSGDDREPIGRKGKPAGRKPPRSRPVRSRRDDDDEEIATSMKMITKRMMTTKNKITAGSRA